MNSTLKCVLKSNIILTFRGKLIEEWPFYFGFVMPSTTNTWENIIEADSANIMPASVLSGNIVIETIFFNGSNIVSKSKVRVYYV